VAESKFFGVCRSGCLINILSDKLMLNNYKLISKQRRW
jgi:hypothetical protein